MPLQKIVCSGFHGIIFTASLSLIPSNRERWSVLVLLMYTRWFSLDYIYCKLLPNTLRQGEVVSFSSANVHRWFPWNYIYCKPLHIPSNRERKSILVLLLYTRWFPWDYIYCKPLHIPSSRERTSILVLLMYTRWFPWDYIYCRPLPSTLQQGEVVNFSFANVH